MLDRIVELAAGSDYDFRVHANPDDPLTVCFDAWVPYYRLKWAIARAIKPERILEIGIRYGYGARSFLEGYPDAAYTGIDNDSAEYGGVVGAIKYAGSMLAGCGRSVAIHRADSQQLNPFPGGYYDLIHVDGRQDFPGFLSDGLKALKQGRYILMDGIYHTETNQEAARTLVQDHLAEIAWYGVIPRPYGDLLIATLPMPGADQSSA